MTYTKSKYTKFGEFMRVKRITHHEKMHDVAALLNTSVPFLSAVETGKKRVPKKWFNVLSEHYNLSAKEKSQPL